VAFVKTITYLSGHGKNDPVAWEFFCTAGRNSGKWTTIGVPSNWELQGFGNYNYGNDKQKADEQGKYRRTFSVPADWAGGRVFIVFDGVMTDTNVSINGKSAGPKHQGGFYRFKYEIIDLVKTGENLLEVTVSKVSSDASVEDAERQADYWVFGGIYRPVYLEAVPKQFIEWIAVDARADGPAAWTLPQRTGNADSGAEIIQAGAPWASRSRPNRAGPAKATCKRRSQAQPGRRKRRTLYAPRESAAGGPYGPHGIEAFWLPDVRGPCGRWAVLEWAKDPAQGRVSAQLLAGLGAVPEQRDQLRRCPADPGDEHERRADVALSAG
jgi:hypothetical protein